MPWYCSRQTSQRTTPSIPPSMGIYCLCGDVSLAIQKLNFIFLNQQTRCKIEKLYVSLTLRLYLYELDGGKSFLSLRLTLLRLHNIIIDCETFSHESFIEIVYKIMRLNHVSWEIDKLVTNEIDQFFLNDSVCNVLFIRITLDLFFPLSPS